MKALSALRSSMKRTAVIHTFLFAQYSTGRFSVVLKKKMVSMICNHNHYEQQITEIITGITTLNQTHVNC
jgi:hypothetical protein